MQRVYWFIVYDLHNFFLSLFQYLKDQNGTTANGGQIKMDPKVAQGSRACSVM